MSILKMKTYLEPVFQNLLGTDRFMVYIDTLGQLETYQYIYMTTLQYLLVPLKFYGPGEFGLSSIKVKNFTQDFLDLDDEDKNCQIIESFEDCTTRLSKNSHCKKPCQGLYADVMEGSASDLYGISYSNLKEQYEEYKRFFDSTQGQLRQLYILSLGKVMVLFQTLLSTLS